MKQDLLVGDKFSEDCACRDDPEANPDAPDVSAEQSDDLMAEEGREGDDDHDADRDKPSTRGTGKNT